VPADSVPRYLFHWTNRAQLEALSACGSAGSLPFPLYCWSHPVTGMAAQPHEIYSDVGPEKARLLILEIDNSNIRAGRFSIRGMGRGPVPGLLKKYYDHDIVFHEREAPGYNEVCTYWREWIIMKPKAVLNFTADPSPLKSFLRREIARLENPSYEYAEPLLHAYNPSYRTLGGTAYLNITSPGILRREIVIPRLRAVLNLDSSSIPAPLRRPFALNAARFPWMDAGISIPRARKPEVRPKF